MKVVPAIDLLGGKVVRLREGLRAEATIYDERPWEVAARFAAAGAELLHVVDLDGAFAGERRQGGMIERIARESGLPVQVGGGIRDAAAIETALNSGARYAVLGTVAVRSPELILRVCEQWPGQIVVAVDARDGKVTIEGWTETSAIDALDLATRAAAWGAAKVLYTDVARDGTRRGPAIETTARLQAALGATPVIASGGIATLADVRALAEAGVAECVIGRALYDGVFTLAEAIAAC
jgi:phosphoribosylformimino-5-aminoimidazole carboxamide ribotide isomerase